MLKIKVPDSKDEVEKQIKALQYQIKRDTNDKDKSIHKEALEVLRVALKEFK